MCQSSTPVSTPLNALTFAVATAGAAAAPGDLQKPPAYVRVDPNGYGFVPFFVDTYGRLGQPTMKLLHLVGEDAAGPGEVTRASFAAGTLRELSIWLCTSTFLLYQQFLVVRRLAACLLELAGWATRLV
jgi:hypothetical protein